jgi:hypothetical protein
MKAESRREASSEQSKIRPRGAVRLGSVMLKAGKDVKRAR